MIDLKQPSLSSTRPDQRKVEHTENHNFREFYESVGRLYPEEDVVYRTLRGTLRRRFVVSQLARVHGRLLDLGCNRGAYVGDYRNGPVVGVDLAYSVLSVARRRFPEISFVLGDAQDLSFLRPSSFDAILCTEVIEHVPQPERLLRACYEVLAPGGSLLLTTPNYRGKRPSWTSVGQMRKYGVRGMQQDSYLHTAFRPEELGRMAEDAGFEVSERGTFEKEVKYATRIPVVFYRMLDWLNRGLIRNARLAEYNEIQLERWSQRIYRISEALGLGSLLVRLVKEGVRTYVLAQKPQSS